MGWRSSRTVGVEEAVAEIERVCDRPGMRGVMIGCYPNGTLADRARGRQGVRRARRARHPAQHPRGADPVDAGGPPGQAARLRPLLRRPQPDDRADLRRRVRPLPRPRTWSSPRSTSAGCRTSRSRSTTTTSGSTRCSQFGLQMLPSEYIEQPLPLRLHDRHLRPPQPRVRRASSGSCGRTTTRTSAPTGRTRGASSRPRCRASTRHERQLILAGNAQRLYGFGAEPLTPGVPDRRGQWPRARRSSSPSSERRDAYLGGRRVGRRDPRRPGRRPRRDPSRRARGRRRARPRTPTRELAADAAASPRRWPSGASGAGSVVSIQLPNRYEAVVAAVAVLSLGAVINPLLPNYRARELGHVFAPPRPAAIFTPGEYRGFDHRRPDRARSSRATGRRSAARRRRRRARRRPAVAFDDLLGSGGRGRRLGGQAAGGVGADLHLRHRGPAEGDHAHRADRQLQRAGGAERPRRRRRRRGVDAVAGRPLDRVQLRRCGSPCTTACRWCCRTGGTGTRRAGPGRARAVFVHAGGDHVPPGPHRGGRPSRGAARLAALLRLRWRAGAAAAGRRGRPSGGSRCCACTARPRCWSARGTGRGSTAGATPRTPTAWR